MQPPIPVAHAVYTGPKVAFLALPAAKPAAISAAMQPPAPCPSWVEVAGGGKRASPKHSTPSDPNAFLNLRISKLRLHNATSPRGNDVYTFACRVCTCLAPLKMATYTLKETLLLPTMDQRFLLDDIAQDVVKL